MKVRTLIYYIILTSIGLLMTWLVIAYNDELSAIKNPVYKPAASFGNQSFLDSLLEQGLQNLKQPTSLLILQIIIIIVVSRITAFAVSFIGQPAVMGETIGGILLGPSLLGWLAPGISHFIFPVESLGKLQALSQLGLIVYMFLVGMKIDLRQLKNKAAEALLISHSGIVFPFIAGIALSLYLYGHFAGDGVSFLSFALFIGIAMSITAFPVLARIVKEKGLMDTMLGTISLSSAAIEDVTAWSMLAIVVAVSKATSIATSFIALFYVLLFIVLMLLVVRPLLKKYYEQFSATGQFAVFSITIVVLLLMVSAITTDILGVHAVFGAFIAGLVMPDDLKLRHSVKDKLQDFSLVFLLPVFFALTGLKTQMGMVNSPYLWGVFFLVLIVAVAGKFGGVMIAARFSRLSWRNSLALGALMNTRGLMGLIALNIGYDLGIISNQIFTMMVMMAIVTTLMTSPLLNLILRKDEGADNLQSSKKKVEID